jgi:integrase
MANIQERKSKDGKISYRVQVRLSGHLPQSATFDRKTDAKRWVSETEAAMREGRYFKTNESRKHTLADMCERYTRDILPSKSTSLQRGQKQQLAWWKSRIGYCTLGDVTPALIAEQRDYLAKYGSKQSSGEDEVRLPTPATVVRYLAALSAAFSQAVNEWGWIETSPMSKVKKPREPNGRIRFLSDDERKRLLEACQNSACPYLYPVVLVAISTCARYGEILGLKWSHIEFERSRAVLFGTKNGENRAISLSPQVMIELRQLHQSRIPDTEFVFASERVPSKPIELRAPWHKALLEANINEFRFHDLRHTAASYLAMAGATSVELSEILGHKTLAMVKRYAHLSETHTRLVVDKMNQKLFPQNPED